MFRRLVLAVFLFFLSSVLFADESPLALVKKTADQVLTEVTAHKSTLQLDSSGIYTLVSSTVLPHFDFEKMTQSAMGKYWRRSKPAQKKVLIEQFRQLLIKTYAVALLNYSGQDIIYLPLRTSKDVNRSTVQTKVSEVAGGVTIPVDYRLFKKAGEWKVYDVVIDGVSLVSNYRKSFASKIRRVGIDGLIKYLIKRSKG